jgi:hypothetical protein
MMHTWVFTRSNLLEFYIIHALLVVAVNLQSRASFPKDKNAYEFYLRAVEALPNVGGRSGRLLAQKLKRGG